MSAITIDGYWAKLQRTTGWERYSKLLINELLRDGRGITVQVAWPSDGAKRLQWEQIALPQTARRNSGLMHFPAAPPSIALSLKHCITTIHDATFLHNPSWMSRGGRWYYRPELKRVLKRHGWIITPSKTTRDDLLNAGADETRVFAAELGIDLPSSEAPTESEKYILFVGTREPRKGLPTLLEAWSKAQPQGWQLLLAGRAGWGQVNSDGKAVRLLGSVSDAELHQLIRKARAVVMPSLYEGFGLPVLEAMARGTLVIASNIAAHREVGGDVPLFFELNDAGSLAEILRDVTSADPSTYELRLRKGIERSKFFSASQFADRTVEAYKAILRATK
jgi:glycosyltransferase involved in cell wall biosynthesis